MHVSVQQVFTFVVRVDASGSVDDFVVMRSGTVCSHFLLDSSSVGWLTGRCRNRLFQNGFFVPTGEKRQNKDLASRIFGFLDFIQFFYFYFFNSDFESEKQRTGRSVQALFKRAFGVVYTPFNPTFENTGNKPDNGTGYSDLRPCSLAIVARSSSVDIGHTETACSCCTSNQIKRLPVTRCKGCT